MKNENKKPTNGIAFKQVNRQAVIGQEAEEQLRTFEACTLPKSATQP